MNKRIVITLEGGLVQWISGIPENTIVIVRDYDVEGADENEISTDENGDECIETEWTKDDDAAA